jgi:hypothetical protein
MKGRPVFGFARRTTVHRRHRRHRRASPARVMATTAIAALAIAWPAAGLATAQGAGTSSSRAAGPTLGGNEQVVFTGRVVVPRGTTSGTVVIFDGPAVIAGGVQGDVVAFNGPIDVSGHVTGNIVDLNGIVHLRSTAQVGGDLSTRERPTIDSGATVRGALHRINDVNIGTGVTVVGRFLFWAAMTIATLVLGLLLLAFAPRAGDAVVAAARARTGAAVGWGIGLFLLLPIAAVLALATLVGIPLGVGVLFALGLIYTLGYLASAHFLGRRIMRPTSSRYAAFLVGWLILRVLALIPVVGGIVWLVASVFGLGALAVAARAGATAEPPVAAPPPLPPAPAAT